MRLLFVAAAVAVLSSSTLAHADTLYYSFTGTEASGKTDTLTFTEPSAGPYSSPSNAYFTTPLTTVTFDGESDNRSQTFNPDSTNTQSVLKTAEGPYSFALDFTQPIYSGSLSTGYTLLTGTFTLDALRTNSNYAFDNSFDFTSGTLVVSTTPPTSTATPEPSSLALLGTGLLGLVATAKRRLA